MGVGLGDRCPVNDVVLEIDLLVRVRLLLGSEEIGECFRDVVVPVK